MPPFRQISGLQQTSWLNDRLPELLWAALLASNFPREPILEVFRSLYERIQRAGENAPYDVRLTGLAASLPASRQLIIDFVSGPKEAKEALVPLLLFDDLPGRADWESAIGIVPDQRSWNLLAKAVSAVLDHQSQVSTDLRWLRVLCRLAAGKIIFPKQLDHLAKELLLYPHFGDQRKVRPSIRSTELVFDAGDDGFSLDWPRAFWRHCLSATACFPLPVSAAALPPSVGTTASRLSEAGRALETHCRNSRQTTAVDPQHETVFGLAQYSLAILGELIGIASASTIHARLALRTLLETFTTLAYLSSKDDMTLWRSFRVYGAGQAKLAALKLDEDADQPLSVSVDALSEIANEDMWEEFLDIDLGHWAKTDLRRMSIEAGTKGDYDRYYPWTSAYAHSHWGAVRYTVFDTCGNPLHRLHRILRSSPRAQLDVVPDAVALVDKIMTLVDRIYPPFPLRLAV